MDIKENLIIVDDKGTQGAKFGNMNEDSLIEQLRISNNNKKKKCC